MPMNLVELLLDECDSLLRLAAVGFELRLAGSTNTDTTDSLAGQVSPHPGQSRQPVFELRKLNLESPLMRLRASREHIQDDRGAVDYFGVQQSLQVSQLRGCQLIVDHDNVVIERLLERP